MNQLMPLAPAGWHNSELPVPAMSSGRAADMETIRLDDVLLRRVAYPRQRLGMDAALFRFAQPNVASRKVSGVDSRGASGSVALFEQGTRALNLHKEISKLQSLYALVGSRADISEALIRTPELFPLLREAARPLAQFFGAETIKQLESLASDEEDHLLRVLVLVGGEEDDAAALMKAFRREWWLPNCARSRGRLVFDYELRDAV